MIDPRSQELIDAYLDGELNADGHAKLIEQINGDPEVALAFTRASFDDRRLRDDLVGRAAAVTGFTVAEAAPSANRSHRSIPWALGLAASVAIVGVLSFYFAQWSGTEQPDDDTPPAVPVATVIDATGNLMMGDDLGVPGRDYPSNRVALESGTAEFQLTSGANLQIRGHVELDLQGSMSSLLRRGFAAFYCPPSAHGYAVDLPSGARVIDLGTRFETRVDPDGVTRVIVREGQVLVRGSDGTERGLDEGQAVAIDTQGLLFDPDMIDVVGASRYIALSFDESDGLDLHDAGRGFESATAARIDWGRPGVEGPDRITGPSGSALAFDGKNDFVSTGFAGIGGDEPRTVAMWVRIPRNAPTKNALAILGYGRFQAGRVWQVSWNSYAKDGPIGALRLGVLGDQIVGDTDLRDGRWHHLAATYDGETARLYVDGELEAAKPMSIDTAIGRGAKPVTIGRNVQFDSNNFFLGVVDEVFVCDEALDATGIARLINTNETRSGEIGRTDE